MTDSIWKPHTTVAAIAEHDGKFLLVKEKIKNEIVFNQPAGHLNPDESLIDAVIRETLEETQYEFFPDKLQGIYRLVTGEDSDLTYIRFLFRGKIGCNLGGKLDDGIISAQWMSYDEIRSCKEQHRSPLVMQCIDDYLNNEPYPLDILSKNYA
jgi:ADP-ribose pyrophosphatase YjhB (NUDIX family)